MPEGKIASAVVIVAVATSSAMATSKRVKADERCWRGSIGCRYRHDDSTKRASRTRGYVSKDREHRRKIAPRMQIRLPFAGQWERSVGLVRDRWQVKEPTDPAHTRSGI